MFRFSTASGALTVLLLLWGQPCLGPPVAAGADPPPRFVPDDKAREAPPLNGSTWVQAAEQYVIRLQQIGDLERGAYIEQTTGFATDPFANRPGQPARFVSFLLEVENRSSGAVELNPAHCWLQTNKRKIRRPLGLTDLSFDYRVAGTDMPPAYERVAPALLSLPRTIPVGESVHGLLVYRNVDPGTRSYRVDVQLAMPNGDVARFAAPYRRAKRKAAREEK